MQDFNPLFTLRYSATHKVDYNKVEATAILEKPQLIICGASAYSQDWD